MEQTFVSVQIYLKIGKWENGRKNLGAMLLNFPLCDFKMFSIGDGEEPSGVVDEFASTVRPCEVVLGNY